MHDDLEQLEQTFKKANQVISAFIKIRDDTPSLKDTLWFYECILDMESCVKELTRITKLEINECEIRTLERDAWKSIATELINTQVRKEACEQTS